AFGSAAVAELPRDRYATGGAINNCLRQIGAVLGISTLIVVLGAAPDLAVFHRAWGLIALTGAVASATGIALGRVRARHAAEPAFGPNVKIFDPSMSTAQIKAQVDAIATQQLSNQFGTQRYALLFMPGTYGTPTDPLNFQVGYYTDVAGLGATPNDVHINGT